MRDYLTTKAPWWLLLLINGGVFFVLTLILTALAPSFGQDSILGALISSVVFG
jgi:hypothetical protein